MASAWRPCHIPALARKLSLSVCCRGAFLFGRVLFLLLIAFGWMAGAAVPASAASSSDNPMGASYFVQPGDSLVVLARRFGLPVREIMRLNGVQHPRELYPGQVLEIPNAAIDFSHLYFVEEGDALAWLGRWTGLEPEALAQRNRMVRTAPLMPGQAVRLSVRPSWCAIPVHSASLLTRAPRLAGSVLSGQALASVLRLNPYPLPNDATLVLPTLDGACPEVRRDSGGSLLQKWFIRPQPVVRGEVGMLAVETQGVVGCSVAYLDRSEPCYAMDSQAESWIAWLSIPPLSEPGLYTVTVTLEAAGFGGAEAISLPLSVAAGRYDYERIDLPADRRVLLDPQRTLAERAKITELRKLRTADRFWEVPFLRPLEAPVTSFYGSRRSYGTGFTSYHAGVDFRAQAGEPVFAPAAGRVVLAEPLVVRGHAVIIDHGWGVVSGFWHLSAIEVEVGELITAGQRVGLVGNTGLSTGPHLHWELWVNGVAVNPLSWVAPESALEWGEQIP